MAADREMILADFQACTGIENIDEAITLLEQNDWNLVAAINGVLPEEPMQQAPSVPEVPPPLVESPDLSVVGQQLQAMAGTSTLGSPWEPVMAGPMMRPTPRMLEFKVEYRERTVDVMLDDTSTVGNIKEVLQAELGIPTDKQHLRGFSQEEPDDAVLSTLNLPRENRLFLLTPDLPVASGSQEVDGESDVLTKLGMDFKLNVRDRDRDISYPLSFPGSRTIREVKCDVYSLTDIPVRNQIWKGWPQDAKDDDVLGYTSQTSGEKELHGLVSVVMATGDLKYSWTHSYIVVNELSHILQNGFSTGVGTTHTCQVQYRGRYNTYLSGSVQGLVQHIPVRFSTGVEEERRQRHASGSSTEDFEDASDSFTVDDNDLSFTDVVTRKPQPLIPDNCDDEYNASVHFTTEFTERYGECHPMFYIGSLEDAMKEAFQKPARDRKLLALYLHHDQSVQSNIFCSQVLCRESIVSYMSQHYLIFAWDMTFDSNKARFVGHISRQYGSLAAQTVRNYKADEYPLLMLVMRNRGASEVLKVVHGNNTVDELMSTLINATDVFTENQRVEMQEEAEREERERMKREQDEAYQVSLAADRAKEEEKRRKEQEEKEEQERAQREAREAKEEREALRASLEDTLPDEPPEDCTELINLRVRLPDGEMLQRRFLASTRLEILLNYVHSKGFPSKEYKLLSSWPKRDLTSLNTTQTLQQLGMKSQETLFLQEK
ncbi:FAS-associated factor 1-like [Branchiostoma floridae]|uniref:FAS-associated factor 1-like n=1 Tax=Branchiostoma floridae TaxID=7739 RepID=A0A9J7NCB9_BRAFL|nr:FAS-associated factor 1-like [Branchiostoma floridae]